MLALLPSFFGNFFVSLFLTNNPPFGRREAPVFHGFDNTVVVDRANTTASARADTRALLRRIRSSE